MPRPNLSFCIELESPALTALFEDPEVLRFLVAGGHRVVMGMLDFSPERAAVVRTLEAAGVEVTAWLLLDRANGYWLNADNAPHGVARYAALHAWTRRENLQVPRVGLDIEPPREHMHALMEQPARAWLTRLAERRDAQAVDEAERAYTRLIETARRDGRHVESYLQPHICDERQCHTTLLRRTLGILDVKVDTEVLMLFRSYQNAGGIRAYFADAQAIALGVTGGGVNADNDTAEPKLDWPALRADLLAAARHSSELYVFSLEGCVQKGMLEQLAALDWDAPLDEPSPWVLQRGRRRRRLFRWALQREVWLDRWLPARRAQPEPRRQPNP